VFKDLHINKKAMEKMKESDIALCLPTSFITCSYGLQRSRTIYLMSKLFSHAKSIRLDVSFATLAMNNMHLCSYLQLIELAKLLGSDDEYARRSIGEINNSLVQR
jgi:RNase P/RNase MRP subunit p30